jgi:hypothetical protein
MLVMMVVRLFCPQCAHAVSKSLVDYAEIDVPVPMTRLNDSGKYEVVCRKGHKSTVVLNNVKFELLFEMGINAIVDGYPREAVSSFSAALERFYEFYWRVAMAHFGIPQETITATWAVLSRQSERQLGAYVAASLALQKGSPSLLSANKEIEFRNKVIHKGYMPTDEEVTGFGDTVMVLMNKELQNLRRIAPEALNSAYTSLLPKNEETKDDEIVGRINILTAVDVMNPPGPGDERGTTLASHLPRVLGEREPRSMSLLSKEEKARRFPDGVKPAF